jgi:hypothetical protein
LVLLGGVSPAEVGQLLADHLGAWVRHRVPRVRAATL